MINVSIARRYARALLGVALDAGRADEVLAELEVVASSMTASSELRDLFESPGFSREQRRSLVGELIESGGIGEPTSSFLKLLVDRGRMEHLPQMTRIYRQLADDAAGRLRAEVQTPRPLDERTLRRLADAVAKVTGKSIELEERVEEGLLGGLVVKVGDRVYDGSLKTQLEKVRETVLG